MKRFLPILGLCSFVIFGAVLLFHMATPPAPVGWKIVAGQGTLHWNSWTKEITLRQHSDHLIVDQGPGAIDDLSNFTVVKDNPEAATLLRVMTGNPSVLFGNLNREGRLLIINPNGIIVGADGIIDLGEVNASTLAPAVWSSFVTTSPLVNGPKLEIESGVVELKAHGNVYALAINKKGVIRGVGSGGSVMIVNPKATTPVPVIKENIE